MIPVIIPARYASSRFPGKPLSNILGKSLIQRVCELSSEAVGAGSVYVATDHESIAEHVRELGYQVIMTSEDCATGSDRVADAMRALSFQKAINVQGDEPMVSPSFIRSVAQKLRDSDFIINGIAPVAQEEDPSSLAMPKMVTSQDGRLLYASRNVIPAAKSGAVVRNVIRKQVCVYGFNLGLMENFGAGCKKTELEAIEDLEILRFIETGIPVEVMGTVEFSLAVDYPEDIERVEVALRAMGRE